MRHPLYVDARLVVFFYRKYNIEIKYRKYKSTITSFCTFKSLKQQT